MWMYPPYPLLHFDSSWGLFRILKWGVIIAVVAQVLCPAAPPAPVDAGAAPTITLGHFL
jgi:hypothetical protein